MARNRKALHAYLGDESHAAWHAYCDKHGISLSALLEVIGLELTDNSNNPQIDAYYTVIEARKVDGKRRRRKHVL